MQLYKYDQKQYVNDALDMASMAMNQDMKKSQLKPRLMRKCGMPKHITCDI